jgi:hypothetical protein
MLKRVVSLAVAAVILFAVVGSAQNMDKEMKGAKDKAAEQGMMKGVEKSFTGTLVCEACDLKASMGARSACKVYGHNHALKIGEGRYVNFLENKYSIDLIKGEQFANQEITVTGIYYPTANILDIESVQAGEQKLSWCDHHNAMDGCMAH